MWHYSDLLNGLQNEPKLLEKFGFHFCLLTIVMNTMSLYTLTFPNGDISVFLLPCIGWNVYTIVTLAENTIEIFWNMLSLGVNLYAFSTFFIVAIFMLPFQAKLTLQVLCFYEYLHVQNEGRK